MNKKETIKFYEECMALGQKAGCKQWNDWANILLTKKKHLQENGEWEEKKGDWENRASVDFDNYNFNNANFNFSEFIFSGDANFHHATFTGDASFESATFTGDASFESATFTGDASFESATFTGDTSFASATFTGDADFSNAIFSGGAGFGNAIFSGGAYFGSATFTGYVEFSNVTFTGDAGFLKAAFSYYAYFIDVTFSGDAGFLEATFSGNAYFTSSIFEKIGNFANAIFKNEASFYAINSKAGFNLGGAKFTIAPNFIQAHFLEAPSLDDVKIPENSQENLQENDFTARYRTLKRMAIQAHDHKSEQDFFAGELKSMRGDVTRSSKERRWIILGYFYEFFSDFGRSFLRPFFCWLVSLLIFAIIYLIFKTKDGFICSAGNGWSPVAALGISLRKALFPFGSLSDSTSNLYACLYGKDISIGLMFIETIQSLSSIILIFLMLLAIRAHFRIK